MPYIKSEIRPSYDRIIEELSIAIANRGHREGYQTMAGDLNYTISTLIHKVYSNGDEDLAHNVPSDCVGRLKNKKTLNYSDYNEIIGVLECAKMEFYRRLAAPYEDSKIIVNGDVFEKENK
jgi:hypothetical protein